MEIDDVQEHWVIKMNNDTVYLIQGFIFLEHLCHIHICKLADRYHVIALKKIVVIWGNEVLMICGRRTTYPRI